MSFQEHFLAKSEHLEAKIAEWQSLAGDKLRLDYITSYSGHKVYAITLSDFTTKYDKKKSHYFAQPHAHEPACTVGMINVIEQLIKGKDLVGKPTCFDIKKVFRETILTFNPIGNPQGREKAPVLCWDGSKYNNNELRCWMRGTDPSQPGKMWKRFDIWDSRKMKAPEPVGIVYEQIDKFRYIEPNRCQLSSYFKLFHKMDQYFHYENWLDLHQTEFEDRPFNCSILLTDIAKSGPKAKEMHQSNILWGQSIIDAWLKAGFRPVPTPEDLLYNATQTRYFQQNWGPLHEKMNIINTEVKNNSPDASADFQVEAQTIPITKSIERLLS